MRTCTKCGLALGIGVCFCAIGIDQRHEFERPSDMVCISPPAYRDYGPPTGCNDGSLPHNRMGWVTSVASASSSVTVHSAILHTPLIAFTAKDAEDAAEPAGPVFEVVTLGPFGGNPPDARQHYYSRPSDIGRTLALIRQGSKLTSEET